MTKNFFCAVEEECVKSPLYIGELHYRVSHWQSSGKTEIEWLCIPIPQGEVLNNELSHKIMKKNQADCFVTYWLDIDDNHWEKATTRGKRGDSFLVKKNVNFKLVPVVPSKVTFTISAARDEEASSTWKILCKVSEVNLDTKTPRVNKIEIISDHFNKYKRYLELLKFGDKFVIDNLNEDRVAFNLQNEEGLTLLIHDLDELQGEKISLLPVNDTDQQSEIKFVVEEVLILSTQDGRIFLEAQKNFEWKGEEANKVSLIPFPENEKQLNNCQGQTIVIKNPLLVKKSNSSLDIGFSYRGEKGELNFERGYENISFEGVGGVEKAFLAIGVVAVILVASFSFISPSTKTKKKIVNKEYKKRKIL
jgi:hypothetical protein